jgi:MFS family permease
VLCGFGLGVLSLAFLRLGVGAGISAYAALSTDMLTSWYKKSSWGKVLGLYNTAMTVGGVLGMVLFAAIAQTMGWRMSFYIIGGISLVVSLLTLLLPDNKKLMAEQKTQAVASEGKAGEVQQVKLNALDTAKFLLSNKALLLMCLGAGLAVMTLNIGSTFMSIYYCDMLGVSLTVAAGYVALSTPIGLIAYPLGGAILDKWYKKDRRARMYMPMLCIALTAVVFFLGYRMVSIPLILLAGGFYNLGNTSFHTAAHELVPVWYKSVSYGIYVLFIQLLGAVGPTLGGIMVDMMGVQNALANAQVFFVISAVLLFFAGGVYIKYYNRAREAELASGVCPE